MMDDLSIPIDINVGKLLEWLISRRHVGKEWHEHILPVREKINNAIQDMPAHQGIAALLSGSYINYFHCLKIVEILKETEADSKNLFGRYGSQRMKDWQEVIKMYEKDNLYIAEAAQMLVRNVNYEIPALKKQIAKQEQLQAECEKKNADYLKNEVSVRSEFQAACKQIGIKGENIKRELVERLKELPDIHEKVAKALKPALPAIELYSQFVKFMLSDSNEEVLPLLRYVCENGNTTVYEWSYGEPPLRIEPDPVHIDLDDDKPDTGKIDFGEGDGIDFGDEPDAIDFGDDAGSGEIDWGDIGESHEPQEVSANLAGISLEESGIVVESDGVSGGVARGKDALTLLDNPATRNQFMDQLVELESFLKMRLYETASSESGAFSLVQELPTESAAALTAMLDAVQVALTHAADPTLTHLHNVKHSPRYVDILTAQLKQKLSLSAKLSKLAELAKQSSLNAANEESTLRPQLALIIERTKELQAEIEKDISKRYKGRPVNMIGGVKFL